MNEPWQAKLDPRTRAAVDEGGPGGRLDVLVALHEPLTAAVRHQLQTAGLTLMSGDGTVVAGHVPDVSALKRLAALAAVRRLESSRPLFGEGGGGKE
ncbi:hypothetical protein Ade02nite_69920 [Paractinoplanes deccanensis]|uniref:Uncharacterized protein n=1 Tax=Paractinoplanes deccanensis TaxID=113561 RepID=A0ABQ3YEA6_9ACTN|nr:hypothetical protein [Actinoplanes deccanensis]GID78351.1 hypothetical protein Ade02nite_69920 [Actinoplanes deccanensis]